MCMIIVYGLYKCLARCCSGIPQRFVVATAVLSGLAIQYIHRLAFNLTITEITYKLPVSEDKLPEVCYYNDTVSNTDGDTHAEFHWSNEDQALLIGSFYIGYIITHVPGGILADKYGPKKVLGYGVAVSAICSLLTPVSARIHVYVLVVVRSIMGFAQGPMFPAQSVFVARWSLPHERNFMNSYMNVGVVVGAVFGNTCTGFMLQYLDKWETVFYVYTAVTVFWYIFWVTFAHNSVAKHPFIGEQEQKKLNDALSHEVHEEFELNYCAVFKSVPVWAMIVGQVGHDWAFYIILSLLPQYMSYVLLYNIEENGLINSLPYVAMLVVQIIAAKIAELLITRGYMSKSTQCKLFFFFTNQGPCVCFVAASYAGCARGLVVFLFTLSMGFMGMIYSCVRVVNVDIAPNYAGFLMALMNGLGSLCGFFGPQVFAMFTQVHTVENWRGAFILSAVLISLSTVVFLIWGTSKVQAWNFPSGSPTTIDPQESPTSRETKAE